MNVSDFSSLTESQKEAVAKIVGAERVSCVEDAVLVYQIKKLFYDQHPKIPEMNKLAGEIREHISALNELLDRPQLRNYLLGIAVEDSGANAKRRLVGKVVPFVNKTPSFTAVEALKDLDNVCKAAIEKQKPGPGRPKGAKDKPIYHLVNGLYHCCKAANGNTPLTNKPGNKLEKVVKILNKFLELGGDYPGIVKNVINSHL